MAVNSNEFHGLRGFVEMPQNQHTDSLGLFKLVPHLYSVLASPIQMYESKCDSQMQMRSGLKQRSFMGFCSVFHIKHPVWTNKLVVSHI